jgi:hypothetical protein
MLEKINNLDVRILYVLMVIAATFPLLRPIGLPLPISVQVKASYNAIETNIKQNDLVFIGVDFEPTQEAELWPQLLAVGRHVASKGARIVLVNMIAGGFRYEERFEEVLLKQFDMKYGVNLLALPFSAGREAAFQSIVADFKGLYKVDLHGKPLTGFPLWNEIKGAKDFKMYVQIADAPDWWLRPMSQVQGLLLWNGTVASGASTMAPLYQSGQMCGFIIGMAGGAEYEVLTKRPGPAAAAMDAQSMGHALIILFVILSNVGYYMAKRKEAEAKKAR